MFSQWKTEGLGSSEVTLPRQSQCRKRLQLGLPIGTASHRLRKRVLFHLVQETGRDTCYRCGLQIVTPEDLVIDHKVAWLDRSAHMFWDLDNIVFSHAQCNSQCRRTTANRRLGPSKLRKVGGPGTAWCNGCLAFLPKERFHQKKARWNGCQDRRIQPLCHLSAIGEALVEGLFQSLLVSARSCNSKVARDPNYFFFVLALGPIDS